LNIPTNIEEFECMEYVCDQIIFATEFENLNMYLKIRLMMEILGEFFVGA
jgi:hypothetical protein